MTPRPPTLRVRRWRRPAARDLPDLVRLLADWPAPDGGAVRHQLPLVGIDEGGPDAVRITGDPRAVRADGGAAVGVAVRTGGEVLAVGGDPVVLRRAVGTPPAWRLLVGDRAACSAVLATAARPARVVLAQRLMVLDPARLPDADALPDPGLRPAEEADLDALAELAVRLHVDDGFGPDPGPGGRAGYRARLRSAVRAGTIDCLGPVGDPVAKLERAVRSERWGTQLAGIVVRPDVRGRGLGRALVAEVARRLVATGGGAGTPAVTLHTRAANVPALRAYAAAGFRAGEDWCLALRP
jgi:ribosomal protein S18 acetylase RimI-like enzyme